MSYLVSHQGNTLPSQIERALTLTCERCDQAVVPGKRHCQAHLDDKRARERKSARRRRQARRQAKQCVDCGAKSKRRRCPACWRKSRGGQPQDKGVNQTWRVDPGTTWNRYRGKARRGRLTREEQIDEDARDARFAIREIEKFVAALGEFKRPEVQALPAIQRAAARRMVGQYLGLAGRLIDDLVDKYSGDEYRSKSGDDCGMGV